MDTISTVRKLLINTLVYGSFGGVIEIYNSLEGVNERKLLSQLEVNMCDNSLDEETRWEWINKNVMVSVLDSIVEDYSFVTDMTKRSVIEYNVLSIWIKYPIPEIPDLSGDETPKLSEEELRKLRDIDTKTDQIIEFDEARILVKAILLIYETICLNGKDTHENN